jgi:hypothetical protein
MTLNKLNLCQRIMLLSRRLSSGMQRRVVWKFISVSEVLAASTIDAKLQHRTPIFVLSALREHRLLINHASSSSILELKILFIFVTPFMHMQGNTTLTCLHRIASLKLPSH